MGQAEQNELRDNARAWVEHMRGNLPAGIGAIVIFMDTKTGDAAIGTNMHNPVGIREILEQMARNVSHGDNLVIPATHLPG
jgi:hypothetical protein